MRMKRTLTLLTFILGLSFGIESAFAQTCNVYAFGDSLSDIGKKSKESMFVLSDKLEPPSKPYFNGRYSDGLVWVEYVKALACPEGYVESYAAGGSYTDERNLNVDIAPDAVGLAIQVDHAIGDGVTFGGDDLVLIWAGANDYIFDTIAGSTPDPSVVVANIFDTIDQLAAHGATKFLVPNMPSLGDTPFAAALDPTGELFLSEGLNLLSEGHNQILAGYSANVNSLGLGVTIVLVDVNSTLNAILANPQDFGFQNADNSCLAQDEFRNRIPTGICPEQGNTFDASGIVFWDLLHPTTAIHQLIAANAMGALGAIAPAQMAAAQ